MRNFALTRPFAYTISEAVISEETMTLHHTKHHNAYVTNLNVGLEKLDAALTAGDVSGIIALQSSLKFNGGGHLNHTLFWENLTSKSTKPHGDLDLAITTSFDSFGKMKAEMTAKTIALQGSGWGWLAFNPSSGRFRFRCNGLSENDFMKSLTHYSNSVHLQACSR